MNMTEMTEVIAKEHRLSKSLSNRILKTVLKTIQKELKQGRLVRLRDFGTFQARKSHGKIRAKFNDSKNFFKPVRQRPPGLTDNPRRKIPDSPSS